jgi:precorrin-2 dehydrogenase/sirohydrochlorin ferrochelatase
MQSLPVQSISQHREFAKRRFKKLPEMPENTEKALPPLHPAPLSLCPFAPEPKTRLVYNVPVAYYPIFLTLTGRRIVVIGGGNVAEGKVQGLLNAEADDLTVISPDLTPGLREHLGAGRFGWREAEYRDGDLEGYDLVFVATDDGAVNAEVAQEARRRRILVNAADDPPYCDFILPSVVRRGRIVVAASTGGSSPAMARRLREDLSAFLTPDYEALADLLAEVRLEMRAANLRADPETWSRAIDEPLRDLLREGRLDEAKRRLTTSLGVSEALAR